MVDPTVIVGAVGAAGPAGGLFGWLAARARYKPDAIKAESEATGKLLEQVLLLTNQVADLRVTDAERKSELKDVRRENEALRRADEQRQLELEQVRAENLVLRQADEERREQLADYQARVQTLEEQILKLGHEPEKPKGKARQK